MLTGAATTWLSDTQCAALGIRLIHLTIWLFGYLKVFDAGAKFSAELVGKRVYGVWGRAPSKFFFSKSWVCGKYVKGFWRDFCCKAKQKS